MFIIHSNSSIYNFYKEGFWSCMGGIIRSSGLSMSKVQLHLFNLHMMSKPSVWYVWQKYPFCTTTTMCWQGFEHLESKVLNIIPSHGLVNLFTWWMFLIIEVIWSIRTCIPRNQTIKIFYIFFLNAFYDFRN